MRWSLSALCPASLALVYVVGCDAPAPPPHRLLQDQGSVCFERGGETAQGHWMRVNVTMSTGCLSAQCDPIVGASCSAGLANSEQMSVSSRGVLGPRPEGNCTDDCQQLVASCRTGSIRAGQYAVFHGGEVGRLTVPIGGEVCFPPSKP